ncbi:alpha/beta hydrolase [Aquipuribacter hungaricus]|uniref:Alpha/beta hydrolase n=1 Tax=Aquipuribacter hungaricus TaxID=545624 RepID=A0ABV7WCT3_9MICO
MSADGRAPAVDGQDLAVDGQDLAVDGQAPATDSWGPDLLGDGYEQQVLELGADPDGEGDVAAVLVRRAVRDGERVAGAVLYLHGFSDYFFQTAMADELAAHGLAVYGLDLRKSGRARRPGQTAHYVTSFERYDEELERSLALVAAAHPGLPVVVLAHSTGGLVAPLWLDRRRRRGEVAPVAGLVLNSPWFDLQGSSLARGPVTQALRVLSRVRPLRAMSSGSSVYGHSLHTSGTGEWDFDTALKPLDGFTVTVGWLNAVRRAQARLHRGLDVGVPSLVLRSDRTHWARSHSDDVDRADTVLDVRQIARWAGCLGGETTVVPVVGARHDVFLSLQEPRRRAYDVLARWLRDHRLGAAAGPS